MIAWRGGKLSPSGVRSGLAKDFGGLIAYLSRGFEDALNPDRVAWTSCRNLDGVDDPARVAQIMRAHAEEHPATAKPVYHFGLSLPSDKHLSREQWDQAVDRVLQALGLDCQQALVVAHRDTAHEHVHVVVNRVCDDGRTWRPSWDGAKAYAAISHIEIEYGLIRQGAPYPSVPALTPGAYQQALHSGQQPLADRVREQAATAFADATSWSDLEVRLAVRGFRLEPAARSSGLLVTDGSRFASLSGVDRSLSGPKLAQRFGDTFDDYRRAHPEPPTVLAPGRTFCPRPVGSLEHRAAMLLDRLAETSATFTAADLHRAVFYQPESIALVREALRSDRVLDLGRDAGGATRYTTREYLDAEARLLAAAASLASRDHFRLDPTDLPQEPAAGRDSATLAWTAAAGDDLAAVPRLSAAGEPAVPNLSTEQRAAVLHATTAADLAQIVGDDGPGAGRTAAVNAIAAAYRERGYEVSGAALTANATTALRTEAGVPSRTLASLERSWSEGADRLHARSVLLLDQAGLLDVRRLGRVLAAAEERGAKVVLLGDPERLQAIGAGDAFRGLLEQHPSACLDPIGRQPDSLQPAASEQLAGRGAAGRQSRLPHGEDRLGAVSREHSLLAGSQVASVLDRCEAAGSLHWSGSRDAARRDLLDAHARDRRQDPGASQLILAHSRAEVAELNHAVRAELLAAGGAGEAGELGPGVRAGYAITVHQSANATADHVYVLADHRMNRRAAGIALTRHRDRVDLFADRETFPSREHLDKTLARAGHKDLASDYAAAELRRAVTRLQDLAAQTRLAILEERPLRAALAALSTLGDARLRVVDARRSVTQAAGRVYADPAKALRSLLRDPNAPARLRQGDARLFGDLHGRAVLGSPNRERATAIHAVASLTGRLDAYQRTVGALQGAKQAFRAQTQQLASPSLQPQPHSAAPARGLSGQSTAGVQPQPARMPRPAQIRNELARVTATVRACQQASRGAQDAIETAIRGMGRVAVDSALLLLPPRVALPVNLAVRAAAHALDRSLDLGLGR